MGFTDKRKISRRPRRRDAVDEGGQSHVQEHEKREAQLRRKIRSWRRGQCWESRWRRGGFGALRAMPGLYHLCWLELGV